MYWQLINQRWVHLIDTLLTLGTHHALTVPDKVTCYTQHSQTFRHNLSKNCEKVFESFITFSDLFLPIHVRTFIFSADKTDKQIRLQNALANFSCCTSVSVISSVHFYLILSTHTHEYTSIVTVYFKWLSFHYKITWIPKNHLPFCLLFIIIIYLWCVLQYLSI